MTAHDPTAGERACSQCAEMLAEIARQGQEITRQSTRVNDEEAEMLAFLDGWFAHARNPDRLVAEDAWRARQTRAIPPATGGALNTLLSEFYNSDDGDYVSALGDIHRHVAAREAAARAEQRERIARAIEAAWPCDADDAARIARDAR